MTDVSPLRTSTVAKPSFLAALIARCTSACVKAAGLPLIPDPFKYAHKFSHPPQTATGGDPPGMSLLVRAVVGRPRPAPLSWRPTGQANLGSKNLDSSNCARRPR